ncbi:MAG: hypothetical protein QG608_3481 [Actinomycetota bacterium]|nr:hypothetical protein [Actinomycetota bacterium]
MVEVSTPRIADLRVQNFRFLRDVLLPALTPFTVVVGPNGSGKSTLFDVFAFLSDSLSIGLCAAWDQRGRFRELRSRGAQGLIRFEVTYVNRERRKLRYVLAIEETGRGPVVAEEKLLFTRGSQGRPFTFLDFAHGEGAAMAGQAPDQGAERRPQTLAGPDLLAVSALGQLADHPRVAEFRSFVIGWYLSRVSAASTRRLRLGGFPRPVRRSGCHPAATTCPTSCSTCPSIIPSTGTRSCGGWRRACPGSPR